MRISSSLLSSCRLANLGEKRSCRSVSWCSPVKSIISSFSEKSSATFFSIFLLEKMSSTFSTSLDFCSSCELFKKSFDASPPESDLVKGSPSRLSVSSDSLEQLSSRESSCEAGLVSSKFEGISRFELTFPWSASALLWGLPERPSSFSQVQTLLFGLKRLWKKMILFCSLSDWKLAMTLWMMHTISKEILFLFWCSFARFRWRHSHFRWARFFRSSRALG